MKDVQVFLDCWRVPLPVFESYGSVPARSAWSLVRCVLLSIADHDGEFTPCGVIGGRVGCSVNAAQWLVSQLMQFGLVVDLGPDLEAPRGRRRGGYKSNVKRLAVNRAKLAELLATPRVRVEGLRWRPRRKAVRA